MLFPVRIDSISDVARKLTVLPPLKVYPDPLNCSMKRPGGRVISAPDFGSKSPGPESHWRQTSAHDCMALNCTDMI